MVTILMNKNINKIRKIIKELPPIFNSHQFIKKFAKDCESDYIEMLTEYRKKGKEKGIFKTVHGQIASYISQNKMSFDLEKEYKNKSENIFGDKCIIQVWEKTGISLKETIILHIESSFKKARKNGDTQIKLRAGDIHKEMELKNRGPAVCAAMKSIMKEGDSILEQTPSGEGFNVWILYNL